MARAAESIGHLSGIILSLAKVRSRSLSSTVLMLLDPLLGAVCSVCERFTVLRKARGRLRLLCVGPASRGMSHARQLHKHTPIRSGATVEGEPVDLVRLILGWPSK